MRTQLENNTLTLFLEGHIDSGNASLVEQEIFAAVEGMPDAELTVDAEGLEYISSAGLRVLMKLKKQSGKQIKVINVSPQVWEIFEITGFVVLFDVHKRIRKISIEGCELIGKGATASVYRMAPDTIVKVYREDRDIKMIEDERVRAKAAFLKGVPSAISFDIVKVGNCYGTVYELLDAEVLGQIIKKDRANLRHYITSFAREIRSLHQIEVEPGEFTDIRRLFLGWMDRLTGLVGTQEEIDTLKQMFEIMPERHTFLHGDCHTENVMLQNGEFQFIDLATSGMGHPVIDLTSMALIYKLSAMSDHYEEISKTSSQLQGFSRDEALFIWDTFLKAYLDTEDPEYIKKAERQVVAYSALRFLFTAFTVPGLISKKELMEMKAIALDYCRNIEPLCF